MGLFDFADDLFSSDLLSTGFNLLSGGSSTDGYLGGFSSGSTPDFRTPVSYPVYQPTYQFSQPDVMQAQPTAAMMPALASGVARWAMRYPQLWQAVQRIAANYRTRITPEKLWSLSKQIGVQGLIGIIGGAAFNELVMYKATHKSRRMNVANTKALRRSVRRLKGFDRLAGRVHMQLGRAAGRRRGSRSVPFCPPQRAVVCK